MAYGLFSLIIYYEQHTRKQQVCSKALIYDFLSRQFVKIKQQATQYNQIQARERKTKRIVVKYVFLLVSGNKTKIKV